MLDTLSLLSNFNKEELKEISEGGECPPHVQAEIKMFVNSLKNDIKKINVVKGKEGEEADNLLREILEISLLESNLHIKNEILNQEQLEKLDLISQIIPQQGNEHALLAITQLYQGIDEVMSQNREDITLMLLENMIKTVANMLKQKFVNAEEIKITYKEFSTFIKRHFVDANYIKAFNQYFLDEMDKAIRAHYNIALPLAKIDIIDSIMGMKNSDREIMGMLNESKYQSQLDILNHCKEALSASCEKLDSRGSHRPTLNKLMIELNHISNDQNFTDQEKIRLMIATLMNVFDECRAKWQRSSPKLFDKSDHKNPSEKYVDYLNKHLKKRDLHLTRLIGVILQGVLNKQFGDFDKREAGAFILDNQLEGLLCDTKNPAYQAVGIIAPDIRINRQSSNDMSL